MVIGAALIVTALRNTQHEFGALLQQDFLGQDGFIAWAAAIMAIGALGYLPGLRQTSRYLLALLAVVMVIRNRGAFANAQAALQQASSLGPAPAIAAPKTSVDNASSGAPGGSSGSAGGSSLPGAIGGALSLATLL